MTLSPKTKKENLENRTGFTLVETLVAVFIFVLLLTGLSAILSSVYKNYRQQSASLNNVFQATLLTANFTNELRNAAIGNDGGYPLNTAGDNQVVFYSSSANGGLAIKRIRYFLLGNILYKGVITPTGNPLAYNPSSEKITVVENGLTNASSTPAVPVFLYYDTNYAGTSSPLSQPINVNNVKFVKINMNIVKQNELSSTSAYTVDAGAAIRNLKNNLGN